MKSSSIKAHLNAVKGYAEQSYARRLKVGALIVKDDRPIISGRNGTPPVKDNNCEIEVNGKLVTKPDVSHAEANAISYAAKHGVATSGASIFLTHSPCFTCSLLIINAGIKEVFYETEYRITDSLELLKENNIKVQKIGA